MKRKENEEWIDSVMNSKVKNNWILRLFSKKINKFIKKELIYLMECDIKDSEYHLWIDPNFIYNEVFKIEKPNELEIFTFEELKKQKNWENINLTDYIIKDNGVYILNYYFKWENRFAKFGDHLYIIQNILHQDIKIIK